MVGIRTLRSIAEVGAAAWDELAAGSYYQSHEWLRSVEADGSARVEYPVAISEDRLLAALPVYKVEDERNDFYRPERLVGGRWTGRYLLAGSRRAYANEVLARPDLDPGARTLAVRALLGELERQVRSEGADGSLFLYLSTAAAKELSAALDGAATPLLTALDTLLVAPGESFEDYLASFESRRRRKLRYEIASFRRAGYDVGEERLSACWQEAGLLLAQLQRRYGHVGDDERWQSALKRQAEALDNRSVVFACRREHALVGFCLAYSWSDTLYVRLAGFDYRALRGAFEYFNVVFYLPLRYLYRTGLRRLHLGRESYDAKLRRGAIPAPLWSLAAFEAAPDPEGASAARRWNRHAAASWTGRYGERPGLLADPGWRMWGCDATP